MFITLQIDLTAIGELMRENPNLCKEVEFKDGSKHKMLNLAVGDKKNPNGKFDLNVNCKPQGVPTDVKWYIGSGCSNPGGKTPNPTPDAGQPVSTPSTSVPTGDSVGIPVDDFPF